ncbi:MAG: hypothetical protein AAGD14_02440 [Planctomycetota bacterium]
MFRFLQGVVTTLAVVVLVAQGRNQGHLRVTKLEIVDKSGEVQGVWEGNTLIVQPKEDGGLDGPPRAFIARGGRIAGQNLLVFEDIFVADKQSRTRVRIDHENVQIFDAKQKRIWKARR